MEAVKIKPVMHRLISSQSRNEWEEYERMKRDFVRLHPEATPEEYMRAMKLLAKELGI